MKQLYNILKKMEARPGMWTGEHTLKSIRIFSEGYSVALCENEIMDLSNQSSLNFNDWIANRLGFSESTAGWQNMILAVTLGLNPKRIEWENYDSDVTYDQHIKSIEKFYELLEEFIKQSS